MGSTSNFQPNFLGGEWSPFASGRMDDPKYKDALTLARNYLPLAEGGLARRSGWRRLGPTKDGNYGRLLAWRFSQDTPRLSEFTDSNMRLWELGPQAVQQDSIVVNAITTGSPAVLTTDVDFPAAWVTGRYVNVAAADAESDEYVGGIFGNRQFVLTVTGADTCTLVDAVTSAPVDGAAFSGTFTGLTLQLILDIATPYTDSDIPSLRLVQSADIDQDSGNPESNVTFLHGKYPPQSLSSLQPITAGLIAESFTDGPYIDPPTAIIPLSPSGTTGVVTLTPYTYDSSQTYSAGDFVRDSGVFYESLLDDNTGNALTGASPTFWIVAIEQWQGSVYEFGSAAVYNGTTYYSLFDDNQNNTPGVAPAAYSAGTTYAVGDAVTSGGSVYLSLANSNVGNNPATSPSDWDGPQASTWSTVPPTWDSSRAYSNAAQPVVIQYPNGGVLYTLRQSSTNNEPDTSPLYWAAFTPSPPPTNLQGFSDGGPLSTDVGRLIRLNWGPASWSSSVSYAINTIIQYNGNIYTSLVSSNKNNEPDLSPADWSIETYTTQWTWAKITDVSGAPWSFEVQIMGQDLPDTGDIWLWQLGLYSDTTGWPTSGAYHEGRLVLAGPQKNRFDMSMSNEPFNFTPTAVDGTVADNNGISYVLNAEQQDEIYWFASNSNGLVAGTLSGEWLVSASSLDDPITPTTIQARRVTTFGAANIESARLPTAQAVVHGLQRKLLEYKIFIDISSYSAIYNATDLTHYAKHLTTSGIAEIAYQSDPLPAIWSRCEDGSVFPTSYKREPDQQYYGCASFDRTDGRVAESIQTQVNNTGVGMNPWIITNQTAASAPDNDVRYVEMLYDLFDENTPLDAAFMADGIIPSTVKYDNSTNTITLYGLLPFAGLTMQVFLGTDWGDWLVAADGTITIAINSLPSPPLLPGGNWQAFFNGLTYVLGADDILFTQVDGIDPPPDSGDNGFSIHCVVGYGITSKGQVLRQIDGPQNGPNFAKTKRNQRAGFNVWNVHEFTFGTDAGTMYPFPLTLADRVTALSPGNDTATGVFRDTSQADYSYDNMLTWQQTRPYPGVFLGVGTFSETTDV